MTVFVVSWLGLYHTLKPICIYLGTIQLLGGGGFNWTNYLIHFLSAEVYFFHTRAIYLFQFVCGDIYLFHFLIYFSVYKFESQTNPSLDLEANDPSKPRLHKCKGHLIMPDIWGSIFLGLLDDVVHKLKSLFNSNLNIIDKIRQLFISRKFSLQI